MFRLSAVRVFTFAGVSEWLTNPDDPGAASEPKEDQANRVETDGFTEDEFIEDGARIPLKTVEGFWED